MTQLHLRAFIDALAYLNVAQTRAKMQDPNNFPDNEILSIIGDNLARIKHEVLELGMPTASHRIARLMVMLSTTTTFEMLSHEIDELFNAVEIDASDEFFSHYRRDKFIFVRRMQDDWGPVFKAFKSAKIEIEEGIDCYALGHNAACVFHMARVGEIGLRTIGRQLRIKIFNRKKQIPIEWGTWGQVLTAIEPEIEKIRRKSNGHQRDVALAFYHTILSDLRAIQNLYRDRTMHLRDAYDDGEAQSAMFRARSLMATLASRLNENSTRAIPWSSWK